MLTSPWIVGSVIFWSLVYKGPGEKGRLLPSVCTKVFLFCEVLDVMVLDMKASGTSEIVLYFCQGWKLTRLFTWVILL